MDQLTNWIPALTTTSLFGGVLWLAKSLILTRLQNSVKSEFDQKIELLRSELKSKEAQIESLRSGAMSGLITRQEALYQRKLQAIDQIWSSVKELEKAKYISAMLGTLNIQVCAKESVKDPKIREFFETLSGNFAITNLDVSGSKLARPFLTPLAWAYYSAYSSIIMQAVAVMEILKIGIDSAEKLLKLENTDNLLKTVLPHRSAYIDQHGMSIHQNLLDEIEELLLLELKNIQDGHEDDKENAKRAAEINKEVEKVSTSIAQMRSTS